MEASNSVNGHVIYPFLKTEGAMFFRNSVTLVTAVEGNYINMIII